MAGLAGMGDLFATCVSPQSRNSYVGRRLGQGVPLEEILSEMSQVAEGVKATKAAIELADQLGISMPIAGHLAKVCFEGRDPNWAQDNLLRGSLGHE